VGVDIYARASGILAGRVDLDEDKIVWNQKDYVAIWKLNPDSFRAASKPVVSQK
jgi:hypothetical protein